MDQKRPISLSEFANNLPPDIQHTDPIMGRLVFGSRLIDTVPYRVRPGAVASVKPNEVINMPISMTAYVYTFNTSDMQQKQAYQTVVHAVAAGWFKLVFAERHWDDKTKSMWIYIEVIERERVIEPTSVYDDVLSKINGNPAMPIE